MCIKMLQIQNNNLDFSMMVGINLLLLKRAILENHALLPLRRQTEIKPIFGGCMYNFYG